MDSNLIMAKAVEDVCNLARESGWNLMNANPGDTPSEKIRNCIQSKVWDALLGSVKKRDNECVFNPAEVGAALIHKGVSSENVSFSRDRYMFQLKHSVFAIKRSPSGKVLAGPSSGTNGWLYREITDQDSDAIAEAMLCFDSEAQSMERLIPEITSLLNEQALEKKKESTIKSIVESTLTVLIDEYVTPLGLKSSYSITVENGRPRVELALTQEKAVIIDAPLEKLADRLKDPEALLDSMKIVSIEEDKKRLSVAENARMRRLDDILKKLGIE